MAKFLRYGLITTCFIAMALIFLRFSILYREKLIAKVKIYSFYYEGQSVQLKQDGGNVVRTNLNEVRGNELTKPHTTVSSLSRRQDATVKQVVQIAEPTKNLSAKRITSYNQKPTTKTIIDSKFTADTGKLCPKEGENLVGLLAVDQTVPATNEKIQENWDEKDWVEKGGAWRPTKCQALSKVAIVIPYRKREEQLKIFVRHMHPMLKRQLLDYRIMVIEQDGETPFNRAMLFNIGYKESLKYKNFTCFVFHDVDLIPENDKNSYGCPTSPRHMSVAIDKFNYRLPYKSIFGGAGCLTREHFEKINGFSNTFWGWGGEDDDLYKRITSKKLPLTRPSLAVGRYKMVRIFHQSAKPNPVRFAKLRTSLQRAHKDGLNSLKYNLKTVLEHPFYTKVTVVVNPNEV